MAFPDDWSNYKEITIDADLVPADGEYVFNVSLKDDADVMSGCKLDGSDIRFTAADGTTQLDFGLIPRGNFVTYTGAYTWFHGDYAVFYGTGDGATNNRTFYAYVTHNGEWAISQYDHDDDAWSHALLKAGAIDDHNNPAVAVRSDGKLLCVYSVHNGQEIYRRVSSAAESIASFAAESAISPDGTLTAGNGYTYPTLLKFTSEGGGKRIYMIYRSRTPTSWRYSYSDDDGETWSAGAALWEEASSVPYMQAVSNGVDRIDFIASDGHGDEAGTAFVHFYYDGTWRSTDGTSAGSPGFIESDFNSSSQVYTSAERWHSDIILNGSNPWILYYRYASAGTNQDLYLARWNGSSWSSAKVMDEGGGIAPATNTHYPGVARFHPEDATVFYAAVEVSGVYEIQKWETSDGGATWAKTEDITSGSTLDNFRPYPVRNAGTTNGRLMWIGNGRYDDYDDLQTGIRCWPPTSHSAAHALVKANLTGATDTTIRVYYGYAGATDGQNKAGVASGYAMFTPMAVDDKGNVAVALDWSSNSKDGTIVGNVLTGYTGEIPGLALKKFGGNDYVGYGTQLNFAGEDEVALLALLYWDETAGTANEHVIFGAWDGATKGNVLWRIEPSNNTIEFFVGVVANTSVGGNITGVTLTPQTYQLVYSHYDNDAASNLDVVGRVNTSEATFTSTNGNVLDADATVAAAIGRQGEASVTDIFYGEIALMGIKLGVLSKDYTDVLANSVTTQSTFRSFGTEQTVGGGGSILTKVQHYRRMMAQL